MTGQWPNGSAHPHEELQDLLDGRASGAVAERIRVHLDACEVCRAEWARLERARNAAALLQVEREVPDALATAIRQALDAEDARAQTAAAPPVAAPAQGGWRWWAMAAAALVFFVYWATGGGEPSVPQLAARDFDAVVTTAALPLERRSNDASDLQAFFADPAGSTAGLRVRVIDLGMMGFALEGARRHAIGDTPSALYVYRGPQDARIMCQMFEGQLDALPPTSDVREHNGFRFQVYREGELSIVFWQEGDIVCVLVSRLPVEDLVQLAFAKAMQPA